MTSEESINTFMAFVGITWFILLFLWIVPSYILRPKIMNYLYEKGIVGQNYCYSWVEFIKLLKYRNKE